MRNSNRLMPVKGTVTVKNGCALSVVSRLSFLVGCGQVAPIKPVPAPKQKTKNRQIEFIRNSGDTFELSVTDFKSEYAPTIFSYESQAEAKTWGIFVVSDELVVVEASKILRRPVGTEEILERVHEKALSDAAPLLNH